MTSLPPPQLGYAQPLKLHRRRWVQRWLIGAAILFLIIEPVSWAPTFWKDAKLVYWQHACLTYTAPPDRIVYENDPAAAAALLHHGKDYDRLKIGWPADAFAVGAKCPECWDVLNKISMRNYRNTSVIGGSTLHAGGIVTLFLHERRSRMGNARLIAIDCAWMENSFTDWMMADGISMELSLKMGSRIKKGLTVPFEYPWPDPKNRMRIFAGQCDPADESHFTIAYEHGHEKGSLNGWLQDDDTVQFEVKHDAAAKPVRSPF